MGTNFLWKSVLIGEPCPKKGVRKGLVGDLESFH